SGNIARQILQGAPFDVFLSADVRYTTKVADAGLTEGKGTPYALGRLVLFAPAGSPLTVDPALEGLRRRIGNGSLKRLAIANPVHAPYGRAAREVLDHHGFWEKVEKRIVLGENISQAAQFALSGSVEGGILSYSLVQSSAYRGKGKFILIPSEHHAPIRHRMVLLKRAGKVARKFYQFMTSLKAREILAQHGFSPIGDV
ncbi:MAG: molybdate ABC transporter substrate-binding protein, partial [Methyloligellaceae bacterium]